MDPVRATIISDFFAWLYANNMCVAGNVPDRLLGTDVLRPLDEADIPNVIEAFASGEGQPTPSDS